MITFLQSPSALPVPVSDVYYHPRYGQSAAQIDGGTWECAVERATGLSYSYIRRNISDVPGFYDTITPYGYGGISGPEATPAEAVRRFRTAYLRAATERGLVAELARLNPLDDAWPFLITADHVRHHTTYGSRVSDLDEEFAQVSGKHRTAVRKAHKAEVQVRELTMQGTENRDHPFRRLYDATMDRIDAREALRLQDEYFRLLTRLPPESVRLAMAYLKRNAIAGAIFLVWSDRVHYHLSASSTLGRSLHATNAVIEHVKRSLIPPPFSLHLGGGVSPTDSLAQFKRRCSSSTFAMTITETITNRELFEQLSQDQVRNGYFPPYRRPKN